VYTSCAGVRERKKREKKKREKGFYFEKAVFAGKNKNKN
jgi:hypothetical protein